MPDFKNIDASWTLFLDRDGVINKKLEGDYVKSVAEFEFLPGAKEAIVGFSKDSFIRCGARTYKEFIII